jgi:hypothetical protein
LLKLAADLDPQHPQTVLLTQRVVDAIAKQEAAEAAKRLARTVDELLAAAAEHLRTAPHQPHDALLAMRKITEALALAPDHTGAQALKVAAGKVLAAQREDAFVVAAIRNARSRFAIGKHQAALQLLENLDASAHPVVADTLKELRAALREIQERQRAEEESAESDDATVISLPEPTAQPAGRQAPKATDRSTAAPLEKRGPAEKPAARQPVGRTPTAPDIDATKVILPAGATGLDALKAGGKPQKRELGTTVAARPLLWGVILGASVLLLLLVLLAVLFRL